MDRDDVPWSAAEFLEWFVGYHTTRAARGRSRYAAIRVGLPELVDDLHQAWYLSVRSTVDRLGPDAAMPDWIIGEDEALAYAGRALRNDASDLGRLQSRTGIPIGDELVGDEGVPVDVRSPEALGLFELGLDRMRRDLVRWHRTGGLGTPSCRGDRVLPLALGVIERLSDTPTHGDPPSGTSGRTDWDRAIYDALVEIDGTRFQRTDGRMNAAARQMKARCGSRVREVLDELARRHLTDVDEGPR